MGKFRPQDDLLTHHIFFGYHGDDLSWLSEHLIIPSDSGISHQETIMCDYRHEGEAAGVPAESQALISATDRKLYAASVLRLIMCPHQ